MLRWPALHFANPQLESSYQASRRRFLLQVDTWHGLLVLAYIPTWLALESQKWASSNGSATDTCVSAYVPFLQTFVRLCNIHAWLVGLWVACGAARLLLLAALWLAPAWYLRARSRIVAAVLLLDACTCTLLRSTHCSLQLPGLRCRQSLLADVGMAPSFVMWHLPLATALPYCATYWAGSSLLHQALSPPGLASASAAAAYPPGAQLLRLLAQLVVPVAVLYWLEKRSRKAFVAAQAREAAGGQGLQEQQLAGLPSSPICSTEHHEKDAPETPDAPGESSRRAARQQDPQAAAATGSQQPSAAAAAGASTAVAAAGVPAAAAAPADPAAAAAAAAALLAYHSPFRRRTITVKVQAPEEGAQEPGFDPAARLTAAVQAAVAALPGGERTVIANQVCIPGCLLYLGRLLVTGNKQRSEQQQQQQQQQQWAPPACQNGTWTVQLSSSAARAHGSNSTGDGTGGSSSSVRPAAGSAAAEAAAPSLVYQTLDDLDAAARDGRLQAGIHGVLQRQAIQPCLASHVVTTWGSRLQLALWWQGRQQQQQQQRSRWTRQRQQQATPAAAGMALGIGGSSSAAAVDGQGLYVRAVLSLGSRVLLDMRQLLPHAAPPAAVGAPGCQWWSLQIDLPPASSGSSSSGNQGPASSSSAVSGVDGHRHDSSSSSSGATAVLTLYILPAESSAPGGECAPLGDVTLLLLPREAAAELTGFVQHNRFTQQLLQPLLTDMAVALAEGTALRSSDGTGAALAAAAAAWSALGGGGGADHVHSSSSGDGVTVEDATLDYLAAAAEAAGKVRQFLLSVGTLGRCEELVAACHEALLAAYASQATS